MEDSRLKCEADEADRIGHGREAAENDDGEENGYDHST